jgi:hypothetical protein
MQISSMNDNLLRMLLINQVLISTAIEKLFYFPIAILQQMCCYATILCSLL